MPHLWPALRGVLWEYWAALLVGGFWGQCSHGMPHVIRIGKATSPRGDRLSSGRGDGAGDALPGAGKGLGLARGGSEGAACPVQAAALGTVQWGYWEPCNEKGGMLSTWRGEMLSP